MTDTRFSRYPEQNISAPPARSHPCSHGKARTAALIIGKPSRKFLPILDGWVTDECFMPGDYYAWTNRKAAQFVRWELQWKILGNKQKRTPMKWPLRTDDGGGRFCVRS
jgi:hypothetical protein